MRIMRSRVLLGVGAWLLGATSATVGSLYAVGQLGNSLLAVPTRQLSIAMVNADLAHEKASRAVSASAARQLGNDDPARPQPQPKSKSPRSRVSPSESASLGPSSSTPAGEFLASSAGGAEAVCQPAGAYLVYWTPQSGYEADDVTRGPAAVASIVFRGGNGDVLMQVFCQGGVPADRLRNLGGPGHDE
jgi:hypothetical protein